MINSVTGLTGIQTSVVSDTGRVAAGSSQVRTSTVADVESFSSVLANMAAGVAQDVRAGEATAIAGINGKAAVQDVVSAVMTAEQSLQTAVAVRDKVVAAYQEISRMAI